jgi:hypothetical protein
MIRTRIRALAERRPFLPRVRKASIDAIIRRDTRRYCSLWDAGVRVGVRARLTKRLKGDHYAR